LRRPGGGGARLALQLLQQPLRDLHGERAPPAQGVIKTSKQAGLAGRGKGLGSRRLNSRKEGTLLVIVQRPETVCLDHQST
jgi:hypothetical protein